MLAHDDTIRLSHAVQCAHQFPKIVKLGCFRVMLHIVCQQIFIPPLPNSLYYQKCRILTIYLRGGFFDQSASILDRIPF